MKKLATTIAGHAMDIQVPDDCTATYAAGWECADWYISNGGNFKGDTPDGWPEEKITGFSDRLAVERK